MGNNQCDIFCCYRGADSATATGGAYGLSEFLAKEFSDFIAKKNQEIKIFNRQAKTPTSSCLNVTIPKIKGTVIIGAI